MEEPKKIEEVGRKVIDTILQKGVDFSITVKDKNLFHKLKVVKDKRDYIIYPISFGVLFQIASLLFEMSKDTLEEGMDNADFIQAGIKSIVENQEKMVRAIGYALNNKDSEPPKSLLKFLNRNLLPKEALQIFNIVVQQMNMQDFLALMRSLGGINILAASQITGELSEELSNTSESPTTTSSGSTVGETS